MQRATIFQFPPAPSDRDPGALREGKLGEQLYRYLRDLLTSGKIVAGEKLPTEKQLCETFRISRPVVREALARLRMDDLIESRRGSGSYVRSVASRVSNPAFASISAAAPEGRESRLEHLLRYYEFRMAIECDTAHYAALRRKPEHLTVMAAAIEEMEAALRMRSLDHEAHFRFHLTIAEATGNQLFVTALHSLRNYMDVCMNLLRDLWLLDPKSPIDTGQHQHTAIYAAIADSKPQEARTAMRLHLAEGCHEVFGNPGEPRPEMGRQS